MNSTRPHVIPIGDKHLHAPSEKCWCHPINKDGVVVHNAKDCREVNERQNVETGKIWVEVLESYQRATMPLVDEVRSGQEYTLALKLESALRNHMENYGGSEYAESAIAAIRYEVGLEDKRTGIELIAAERERQITAEGWTPAHDGEHTNAELERAALCYLDVASSQVVVGGKGETYGPPDEWPWELEWWKPSDDPLRNMAKAGALIAAAMDRFIRHNVNILP